MNRKIIVVDTNIVFKALRLKNSFIREILNQETYHFFAPKFYTGRNFQTQRENLKE